MRRNPDCVFCKIVAGEIPCDRLYEDDEILAFRDINPQAPFHALLIPKTHLATLNDLEPEHAELVGRLFLVAKLLAEQHNLPAYRVVVNTNAEAGQTVFHVHMHLLAGRPLKLGLG
ncbi:MAG: histidine triad nucleotide-binding protein [Rhodospirillaceae bacterium]|nr:histidine triad nucleotide-binding protein [Rhodospirillaceae bacterium]MDE0000924.1 histidine triad nucleotide-binding protein [Rhodospirillaceae bacterium]